LPKSFRLEDKEVYIEQLGEVLLLIPKGASSAQVWETWYENLGTLEQGFKLERKQPKKVDRRQW
jgi:virulence-associated protein VagC